MDAATLRTISLVGGHSGTIPTLDQLLELVAGRAPVLVELKSDRREPWRPLCRAVADALRDYRGEVAVMSFDPRMVRWFSAGAPDRPRGLVVGRRQAGRFAFALRRALAIRHVRPDFLACDLRDLPDPAIAEYRRRGMIVLGWTANSAASRAIAERWCDAPIAEGAGLA